MLFDGYSILIVNKHINIYLQEILKNNDSI